MIQTLRVSLIFSLTMVQCVCCSKSRIYDEESESDGRRPWCGCCTCCSSADDDDKPNRPVKRKPRGVPVKTATTKKKVVSKRGNMFNGKKGGKKVKKGTTKSSIAAENTSSNSRKAKKVAAWRPFANPVRNINTSTK